MKPLFTLLLVLIGQVCIAAESLSKLTSKEVLTKLNKEDLLKVVFWLKPNLSHYRSSKPKLDPYYDPKWMVSIYNNTEEDVVINRWWFNCSTWLNMIDAKSGNEVSKYSSFPPEEIIPVVIKKNKSIELELGLHEFTCFETKFDDERSEMANPGEYKVTHDIFPSAELRFSITSNGIFSVVMIPIYKKNK